VSKPGEPALELKEPARQALGALVRDGGRDPAQGLVGVLPISQDVFL